VWVVKMFWLENLYERDHMGDKLEREDNIKVDLEKITCEYVGVIR
jgi:hypothetical protein